MTLVLYSHGTVRNGPIRQLRRLYVALRVWLISAVLLPCYAIKSLRPVPIRRLSSESFRNVLLYLFFVDHPLDRREDHSISRNVVGGRQDVCCLIQRNHLTISLNHGIVDSRSPGEL